MQASRIARAKAHSIKAVELALRTAGQAPEQRAARRLAADAPLAPGGSRVLFLTPRDWAAHVQYEGVIAQALRLRGADVRFLSCGGGLEICDRSNTYEGPPMPCTTCDRYVRTSIDAHGFPRTSLRELWEAQSVDPGDWSELDALGTSELEHVMVGDLDLGGLVDKPVRWFLLAANVEDDPLGPRVRRGFLRSARRILKAVEDALDRHQPDVVVLLNGLFLFESITWALCRARGIDVVTYERAFLKETLVFSRRAPAGLYDFSEAWADSFRDLTDEERAEIDQYLEVRRTGQAFDQYWRPRHDPGVGAGPGRLVTLFTNVTWDTAVVGRHRAFPDIQAWVDAAIEAFRERPQHRLVIHVHPSEIHLPGGASRDSLAAYIARSHPDLPSNIRVIGPSDPVSSYSLMSASDVGLVYTSTTGLELAVSGVPTIVAGDTHYRGKGFTIDVESPEEFTSELDAALADPRAHRPDVSVARRYAHFFFFRAPLPAPGVVEPLPGLARLTVEDLSELAPGRNESLDRICDGILHGTPFVTGTG